MSLDFFITSLIVVLVPGTGVIYTLSQGIFRGPLASSVAAIGCTLGILPHIAASLLGIAALLHTSALIFQVFKIAGVAYLLYLAWRIWRESDQLQISQPKNSANLFRICLRGFLINILNPKLSIFFLAFLPQFIPTNLAEPLPLMLLMSGLFMVMTLAVFILYGLAAAKVSNYFTTSPKATKWLQRSFAAAFAGFGLKLANTDN